MSHSKNSAENCETNPCIYSEEFVPEPTIAYVRPNAT